MLKVSTETLENQKIITVKLPRSNQNLIFEFLKDYTIHNKTFYLYFHDDSMYSDFNNVYKKLFYSTDLKLIKCTKLVNTVRNEDERIMTIKYQHESKCNHRGIAETLEHIKRNYYWPSLKKDVTDFISNCNVCNKTKYYRKTPYIPLVLTEIVGKPFQLIHMDIFKFDNQSFLTIIDAFSKLGQAIPITGKTAIAICDALLEYLQFYGTPARITADNGKEFKNESVSELLTTHKINIHFTTPFHHESNSLIERFHSTLIEHLRILRETYDCTTPTQLMKYAIIAYNNSIHSSTNFTPLELTLGHTDTRDPTELTEIQFYTDYVFNHKERLKHLYKSVSEKLETKKEKVITLRNNEGPQQ